MLDGREVEVQDFYRKETRKIATFKDLTEMHKVSEEQRVENSIGKLRRMAIKLGQPVPEMEPDDLLDWCVKRAGICPHGLVSGHSTYWWSTISSLDGEMGLTMPRPDVDLIPNTFWEALSIIRGERHKLSEEEDGQKDRHHRNP